MGVLLPTGAGTGFVSAPFKGASTIVANVMSFFAGISLTPLKRL
jgi:hypothetical protein